MRLLFNLIFLSLALLFCDFSNISEAEPLTNVLNKHNLSSSALHTGPHAQSEDRICIFCHTPHAAAPESTLWSRPDPSTASFPLYGNQLIIKGDHPNAPAGAADRSQYKNDGSVTYPNGASRMCLSCHDGVTAIGILRDGTSIAMSIDFVNNPGINSANPKIDLSTSHPISFVYDNAVWADINTAAHIDKLGKYQLPPSGDGVEAPLDGQDRMQCTTCHDPHNDTVLDGGGLPPFWRHTSLQDAGTYSDVYEELCGQCHIGGSPLGNDHTAPGI